MRATSAARRGALGGGVVEHVVAQRRVADQRADVERRLQRRDRVEVLAGTISQSQVMPLRSAGRLMPSTRSSMRIMRSRPAGRHGASVKPQLPITTLVTPFQHDGVSAGSQQICAS